MRTILWPALLLLVFASGCQAAIQTPTTGPASPTPASTTAPASSPTARPSPAGTPTPPAAFDIAYVKDGEIWLASASGARAHKVARGGPYSALSWSPDGKLLAAVAGKGFSTQLRVLDVAAGSERSFDLHPYEGERPSWSPDGSMLAFPLVEDRNKNGHIDPTDFGKIAVLRLADGSVSTFDGRWASWHPRTGELLVATMGTYRGGIYRDNSVVAIDVASGTRKTLMEVKDVPQDLQAEYNFPFGPSTILLAFPQMSPDGTRLAFTALGHTGLVGVQDLTTRKVRLFGFFYEGGAGYSTWSLDGRHLAYEGYPASGQGAVGLVDVQASKEVILGGRPDGGSQDRELRQPSWSADGKSVAVAMVDQTGQGRIAILDPSGNQIARLDAGSVSWPTWNPARR